MKNTRDILIDLEARVEEKGKRMLGLKKHIRILRSLFIWHTGMCVLSCVGWAAVVQWMPCNRFLEITLETFSAYFAIKAISAWICRPSDSDQVAIEDLHRDYMYLAVDSLTLRICLDYDTGWDKVQDTIHASKLKKRMRQLDSRALSIQIA